MEARGGAVIPKNLEQLSRVKLYEQNHRTSGYLWRGLPAPLTPGRLWILADHQSDGHLDPQEACGGPPHDEKRDVCDVASGGGLEETMVSFKGFLELYPGTSSYFIPQRAPWHGYALGDLSPCRIEPATGDEVDTQAHSRLEHTPSSPHDPDPKPGGSKNSR